MQKQYSKTFIFYILKILEIVKNNLLFTKYANVITGCFYKFRYMGVLQIVYMNLKIWRKYALK